MSKATWEKTVWYVRELGGPKDIYCASDGSPVIFTQSQSKMFTGMRAVRLVPVRRKKAVKRGR